MAGPDHRPPSSPEGQRARSSWRPEENELRVLGFPRRAIWPEGAVDLPWARHPVRWLRWRRLVRRLGPYAPGFDEVGRHRHRDEQGRNEQGRDEQGRNEQGRGEQGRNEQGRGEQGRNEQGRDEQGRNEQGRDEQGPDVSGPPPRR